jgi:hypothetical protein
MGRIRQVSMGAGMALYQGFRPFAAAGVIAATTLVSACGGGGGGSASPSASSPDVLNLSTAVQSEHVAEYAGAFGMLSGPGVAAIYTSIVSSFVQNATASSASSSKTCPTGGSVNVVAQNAGSDGLRSGETATVTFNQCIGQVQAPTVASDSQVSGSVTVQVQDVTGVVGSTTQNWSYTATETANSLTLVSGSSTNTLNGTVTYSMSFDAATGVTTTTASAPSVTIGRTQTTSSSTITGAITVSSLAYSRTHGPGSSMDTLSTSGAVSVTASDAIISFNVSTPTPVVVSDNNVQAGVVVLSTDNTVETITAQNATTVGISVTSGGKTGTYTESLSDFTSIAGG